MNTRRLHEGGSSGCVAAVSAGLRLILFVALINACKALLSEKIKYLLFD